MSSKDFFLSNHQDIISARLSSLYQLPIMNSGALILPINTVMQRVCPYQFLQAHELVMKTGQQLSGDKLRHNLNRRVTVV